MSSRWCALCTQVHILRILIADKHKFFHIIVAIELIPATPVNRLSPTSQKIIWSFCQRNGSRVVKLTVHIKPSAYSSAYSIHPSQQSFTKRNLRLLHKFYPDATQKNAQITLQTRIICGLSLCPLSSILMHLHNVVIVCCFQSSHIQFLRGGFSWLWNILGVGMSLLPLYPVLLHPPPHPKGTRRAPGVE